MYNEDIDQEVTCIQKKRRRELLTYRQAVICSPKPKEINNLRSILTKGSRIRHITSFLGIKPVIPVTNVFKLLTNDVIHIISLNAEKNVTKRANCAVIGISMYNHYYKFPESRELSQDLLNQTKYCIEIKLASNIPGAFSRTPQSFCNIREQYLQDNHPDATFNINEYPFPTTIYCFTDDSGNIINFIESKYIMIKI